jgi:hypothetical protein
MLSSNSYSGAAVEGLVVVRDSRVLIIVMLI